MAKKKLKIGVLFGGKSAEHEISIRSAENVIKALNKKKYRVIPVKINKNGKFSFSIISKMEMLGSWSTGWPDSNYIVSQFEGLQNKLGAGTKLLYAYGCGIEDSSRNRFDEAIKHYEKFIKIINSYASNILCYRYNSSDTVLQIKQSRWFTRF